MATSPKKQESTSDLVNYYLAEIGSIPRLTTAQEQEYGRRSQAGDFEARDMLIRSNLLLTVSVAKKYSSLMPFMELVSEGMLGLIKAAQEYDPSMGKFSTYAVWWIRQCIRRYVKTWRSMVRIPEYQSAIACRSHAIGIQAALKEIADNKHLKPKRKRMLIQAILASCGHVDVDFYDRHDPQQASGLDVVLGEERTRILRTAVYSLPMPDRKVIIEYFGIGDCDRKTARQIAVELKCTASNVGEIKKRALRLLFGRVPRSTLQ